MAGKTEKMALSPGQTFNGQRVRRIPRPALKIGTWNIRSMFEAGKIHNTIKEMSRLRIDVMGISEMRWPGNGECQIGDHIVYYAGNEDRNHRQGVGLIIKKELKPSIISCLPYSDRVILLKIRGNPFNINLIQVYAPTADKGEEIAEDLYAQIGEVLKNVKTGEVNMIMGDFNAKVGQGKEDDIVGNFGLGQRNERGDRLIQFCREERMIITNTLFKLPPRRLYTWKAPTDKPDNIVRNQIDFILINQRFRNSITSVKTYPGADVPSDHTPLVCVLRAKPQKSPINHNTHNRKKYEVDKLQDEDIRLMMEKSMSAELENTPLEDLQVEEMWTALKGAVIEACDQYLTPTKHQQTRKQWMTVEILEMMDERRKVKNADPEAYRQIHRTIKQRIREAKEKWMSERCQEIEELDRKHDSFNMYKKIKEVTGRYKRRTTEVIMDEQGKLVYEVNEKLEAWQKYILELFKDDQRPEKPNQTNNIEGPAISIDEVKYAIEIAKSRKASGPDHIPAELLKIMNQHCIAALTSLFNKIYESGTIPDDWLVSTFIIIPKKPNPKSCEDYRTISLMSHILKIFLKIIHARLYKRCEDQMGESQFGFRNGIGTREALFAIQVLIQRCRDMNCDAHVCFIDYAKAFDRCQHETMVKILHEMGLDGKDIRIIANLYWNQRATITVENRESKALEIKRGVRQGCILSPLLFNLYSEKIFRKALEDTKDGIKVNGELINNIRYADDTVLLADSLEGLQELVNRVTHASKQYGLELNIKKTKYMVISKLPDHNGVLYCANEPIERVASFTYLGSNINDSWDHSREIKCRIEKARAMFTQMKHLLCCRDLSMTLKKRMIKSYIFSILLYGVEAWTLTEAIEKRIQSFETWIYRRILRISWTDRITNEEVLRRMNCQPVLMHTIKQRKLEYLGHIMRNPVKYRMLQLFLQGKVEGKRGPGRRRISWLANLRKWFGVTSTDLFRAAANKARIAMMIANIRNG